MANKLAGKRALVTGSDTGIGRVIGLECAKEGAAVAFHSPHGEGASKAAEEVRRAGGKAAAFIADFNRIDQVQSLAAHAVEFLGGIDVLINNAGITMNQPFDQVKVDQFDTLYHVNVRGPFFLTQAVVPEMIEQGRGVIINIASIHAFQGMQEHSIYAGTKGAIVAYTRQLAVELASRGIRVNAIAPGAIEVENYYKIMPDFDPETAARNIPAGFFGQPSDIARVAVFLASEDARYIIGQTLIVDGGTTAWMPFSDGFREPLKFRFGQGDVSAEQ